ncbi:MAG: tetratricopeptide repeat protein [Flavisolibacter sp.]|jgi:tetratricopeptide (TPR) repeat protein
MKKSAIVLCFAAFLSITALAQNVQEGVNNYYAERYTSAKSVFDKLLAANPNNIEATYWLGQVSLAQDDIAGAKAIYDKALTANGNAPLILVGVGHVELLQGNAAAARQHFEQAITASKGRKGNDPVVLDAIGRANVDAYTESKKLGDLDYAIAKLNEAAEKAPNNPDIFLNLGNAYRKKHQGSDAVQAYRKAGNFAPALFRTAMLYMTQTNYRQPDSWGVVLENLNSAIAADPKFAPAYEQLYYYNLLAKQDFATAESFANKYISSSDPSPENQYFLAQTQFVQKKYNDAISNAKNIVTQTNNNPKPRVYRLLAYSYLGNKDTATACQYTNEYFAKAKEEDVRGDDYLLHAYACGKGNPDIIRADITKAVQSDSVLSRQVKMLDDAAKDAKASGHRDLEGWFNLMSYQLRGTQTTPTELINDVAVPFYFGGNYQQSDSAAKAYAALAPDSIYGYYWSALALGAIDTTMEQGLAMPDYQKVLDIAEKDKVRFKSQGVRAATTLAIYSYNIKNDKEAALAYADRGLAFDPTNANLLNVKNVASTKSPTSTPKTSNGSSGTKAKKKG